MATPTPLRLLETPALTTTGFAVSPRTANLAEHLARRLRDPALVAARLTHCWASRAEALVAGAYDLAAEALQVCVDVVSDGLRAAPASGALWLERARLLTVQGDFGERFVEAMQRSWETAPREGWIAAERVAIGIAFADLLPPETAALIGSDLGVVLDQRSLSGPLLAGAINDPAFRERTIGLVRDLRDLEHQERFTRWLMQEVRQHDPVGPTR